MNMLCLCTNTFLFLNSRITRSWVNSLTPPQANLSPKYLYYFILHSYQQLIHCSCSTTSPAQVLPVFSFSHSGGCAVPQYFHFNYVKIHGAEHIFIGFSVICVSFVRCQNLFCPISFIMLFVLLMLECSFYYFLDIKHLSDNVL